MRYNPFFEASYESKKKIYCARGWRCYSAKTVVPPTHTFADPNRKSMFLPEYIRQGGCGEAEKSFNRYANAGVKEAERMRGKRMRGKRMRG